MIALSCLPVDLKRKATELGQGSRSLRRTCADRRLSLIMANCAQFASNDGAPTCIYAVDRGATNMKVGRTPFNVKVKENDQRIHGADGLILPESLVLTQTEYDVIHEVTGASIRSMGASVAHTWNDVVKRVASQCKCDRVDYSWSIGRVTSRRVVTGIKKKMFIEGNATSVPNVTDVVVYPRLSGGEYNMLSLIHISEPTRPY